MLWLYFTIYVVKTVLSSEIQNNIRYDSAKVLQMLVECGGNTASLRNELQEMKEKMERLSTKQATDTYTRWGRYSCPNGATTVYDGFAAGSHYTHRGAAANYICLSKKPIFTNFKKARAATVIYGTEYQTYDSSWARLADHEVPCVVCQVPRTSIIMVSGRNDCPDNFKLEYGGFLMAGHYSHHATEYVCMDGNPTATEYSSRTNHDGALFYFVEARCGSLKCRPYKTGQYITCAVCSYMS